MSSACAAADARKPRHLFSAIFIFIFLALFSVTTLRAQNLLWAKQLSGPAQEWGLDIETDAAGNVYTAGYFQDTVDFDPGVGVYNLISNGGTDVFVTRFDPAGNFVWAKSFGGTYGDVAYNLAIDPSGDLVLSGYCYGMIDFDPGPGVFNLNTNAAYVCKLDANGNFIWAKSIACSGQLFPYGMVTDNTGTIYMTGLFSVSADFDPGTAVYTLSPVGPGPDCFLVKLDASGNFVWAKDIGGDGSDQGEDVVTDAAGNVYVCGEFSDTVDFDPGSGVHALVSLHGDCFLMKLDASGNFQWVKQWGNTASALLPYGLRISPSNAIYMSGRWFGTLDFDPGPATDSINSPGGAIFVIKLNSAGNFVWAKTVNAVHAHDYCLALNNSEHVFTAGYFSDTADFDPGPGMHNMISAGPYDGFLLELDSAGNWVWSGMMGGTGTVGPREMTIDAAGNEYLTGIMTGIPDFDPGPGVDTLHAVASYDAFVCKFNAITAVPTAPQQISISLYPNPGNGDFIVQGTLPADSHIEVYDMLGQMVYDETLRSNTAQQSINLQSLAQGMYVYRIVSSSGVLKKEMLLIEH